MLQYIKRCINLIGNSVNNIFIRNYSQYYYTDDTNALQNDFEQVFQDIDTVLSKTIYKGDNNK